MSLLRKDIEQNYAKLLKHGDVKAFNYIFDYYNQRLYFFALGYVKSEIDAEEIVQDTFLKLWERRESLDLSLSLHAYLFKISFNFIQKKMIKNFKEEGLKHHLAGEIIQFDDNTSNTVNYHFLLRHITVLIETLPPRQKQILELRMLDRHTTKEISEMLSISIKTVESHLTAGLKFLKTKLAAYKIGDLLLITFFLKKYSN